MIEINPGDSRFDDTLAVVVRAASRREAIAAADMVAIEYYADLAHDHPEMTLTRYVGADYRGEHGFKVTVDYSPKWPEPINDAVVP